MLDDGRPGGEDLGQGGIGVGGQCGRRSRAGVGRAGESGWRGRCSWSLDRDIGRRPVAVVAGTVVRHRRRSVVGSKLGGRPVRLRTGARGRSRRGGFRGRRRRCGRRRLGSSRFGLGAVGAAGCRRLGGRCRGRRHDERSLGRRRSGSRARRWGLTGGRRSSRTEHRQLELEAKAADRRAVRIDGGKPPARGGEGDRIVTDDRWIGRARPSARRGWPRPPGRAAHGRPDRVRRERRAARRRPPHRRSRGGR